MDKLVKTGSSSACDGKRQRNGAPFGRTPERTMPFPLSSCLGADTDCPTVLCGFNFITKSVPAESQCPSQVLVEKNASGIAHLVHGF